jgi:hypothetical protein
MGCRGFRVWSRREAKFCGDLALDLRCLWLLWLCVSTCPLLALILGARSREAYSSTTRLKRVLCLIFPCFLRLLALLSKTPFLELTYRPILVDGYPSWAPGWAVRGSTILVTWRVISTSRAALGTCAWRRARSGAGTRWQARPSPAVDLA